MERQIQRSLRNVRDTQASDEVALETDSTEEILNAAKRY